MFKGSILFLNAKDTKGTWNYKTNPLFYSVLGLEMIVFSENLSEELYNMKR